MQTLTEVPFQKRSRIVPFSLDAATVPADALSMFRAWVMAYMDDTPDSERWIPVGRVGPMVILGHHDPLNAPAPSFPLWAFGLSRIPESVHRKLREQVASRLQSEDEQVFDFDRLSEEKPHFPEGAGSLRKAVEILLTFPGAARDGASVRSSLSTATSDTELVSGLPPGWRESAMALAHDMPVVDLGNFIPSPEIAHLIPENFAREHDLVPLAVDGATLIVACPTPENCNRAHYIRSSWKAARDESTEKFRLSFVLCSANARADVERRAASRAKASGPQAVGGASNRVVASIAHVRTKMTLQRREFDRLSIDTPNIDDRVLLKLALYRAIELGASDLHIDIEGGAGRMRVRRDNFMRPLGAGRFAIARLSPLIQLLRVNIEASGGDLDPVDGKFSLRCDDSFFDVRVSILPAPDSALTHHGYAVLRFLPKDGGVRSLTDLQMEKNELAALMATLDKPNGIVLVTGPTGSGKTTTLNAMIQQLNKGLRAGEEGTLKILTAEDPIEYTIDGVQQINVSKQIDFAEAIRRFLRQDPDVILVGEIRDKETADAAISAARTGHLVFSSLHTNGAAETISRLLGMGVPAYDLDGTLLTVVAQRLVPRLCTNCKTPRPITPDEVAMFTACKIPPPTVVHQESPTGCPHCDKGWHGRIPVLEIVKITKEIRRAITRRASESELQDICLNLGFAPIHQQALIKVALGDTSIEQATQLHGGWD